MKQSEASDKTRCLVPVLFFVLFYYSFLSLWGVISSGWGWAKFSSSLSLSVFYVFCLLSQLPELKKKWFNVRQGPRGAHTWDAGALFHSLFLSFSLFLFSPSLIESWRTVQPCTDDDADEEERKEFPCVCAISFQTRNEQRESLGERKSKRKKERKRERTQLLWPA